MKLEDLYMYWINPKTYVSQWITHGILILKFSKWKQKIYEKFLNINFVNKKIIKLLQA